MAGLACGGAAPYARPMLHLTKLAVGVRDISHLRDLQLARAAADPPHPHQAVCHRTRNFPRQAAALLDGGSIYWVIGGAVQVRQTLLDIAADRLEDGSACAALLLDSTLVPVLPRPVRPFQGWRYLSAEKAPPDLAAGAAADGSEALPPELRLALRALCLI